MVDVTDIIEYCKEHKIYFIEDAPQSIGSSFPRNKSRECLDIAVLSFNTNKVVAGINGGGVSLTNNESKAELAQNLDVCKDKDFSVRI